MGFTPSSRDCGAVPRAVEEESRDVFNSNGEVYENACDLPPAADCGAVPQAVEEGAGMFVQVCCVRLLK